MLWESQMATSPAGLGPDKDSGRNCKLQARPRFREGAPQQKSLDNLEKNKNWSRVRAGNLTTKQTDQVALADRTDGSV
jgi:hypothetical protein